MSDPSQPNAKSPGRKRRGLRRAHGVAWSIVAGLAALLVVSVAALAISETRLVLPQALTERIERRINRDSPLQLGISQITVGLDRSAIPRLWIDDVGLEGVGGQTLAQVSRVGLAFDPGAAIRGRVAPRVLRVEDATLTLRRDRSGAFEISFGGGGQRLEGGLGGLLQLLDRALQAPPVDRVERVELTRATITVEDARAARVWQLSDAGAVLRRTEQGLELSLNADIFNGSDTLGALQATVTAKGGDRGASAQVTLSDVSAADIALQSPALSFLSVLDAPLSGALRAEVGGDGGLTDFAGTLEIGAGTLAPRTGGTPLGFEQAKAYFTYDPDRARLNFSQISATGALGEGRVSGHAYLDDLGDNGFPRTLLAQMALDTLALDAPRLFPAPITLGDGQLDLRIRLNPFRVEIGQISLPDAGGAPGRHLHVSGSVEATPEGWQVSADGRAEALGIEALLRLWPLPIAPKARGWLSDNINGALAENVVAALRFAPGDAKPRLNLTFGFRDADVRVMKGLPPVTQGAGLGSIMDHRLVIQVDEGVMKTGARGDLDLAGSVFTIPDGRIKPSPAVIDIAADGPLGALFDVLDAERFQLLSKSGRDADLATGRITGSARIGLVLKKGNTSEDIDIAADAVVRDFASDTIVGGRALRSDRLDVSLAEARLSANGRATLDGVAFQGAWRQALAGPDQGQGSVSGTAELGPEALERFGVKLPRGLLTGRGPAQIDLALRPGAPATLQLSSELRGLGLNIPAVNWSKPADTPGRLDLALTLAETPRVDGLSLSAPGLSATGDVVLGPGPSFEALELDRVRLGGWLDAAVTIRARGAGQPPAITVRGGEIDIRRAQLGGGGGGSGAARGPVSLRLDRLRVTDTLALGDFSVDLAPGRALSGDFRGRINGGVTVAGALAGGPNGTAIRIRANDAGAVLRDAGLFRNVEGGALELTLRPGGGRGIYEGALRVTGPRLRNAPTMAELLSAISVVGLLEQMQGQGIPFDEVSADFRLSPSRITLYRSSATGNSLGLSMDGVYDPQSKRMDMQGVVSPLYLLNRVGSIFTRRGEGLFGVSFTLRGTVSDPAVAVNPLSILTPGMFREIFRRPPPERVAR
ncbi:hypothetical protein ILP92_03380 [Maribius pontilimi]|uniref:AsmA-like C-terminal region n=1 Tax=Palleronia pontilimi TaxID=1964209 RepID=A0A934IH58_9RHOB|nr:DUF3971 domain-containing protein [Palleronia pontilimi]MBJ3761789.1 hypothetical protein [Palleronia pontilimi]